MVTAFHCNHSLLAARNVPHNHAKSRSRVDSCQLQVDALSVIHAHVMTEVQKNLHSESGNSSNAQTLVTHSTRDKCSPSGFLQCFRLKALHERAVQHS